MACNRKHCSGCNSCRRNSFARVNYPDVTSCSTSSSGSCGCGSCCGHHGHHCGGCNHSCGNSCSGCGCDHHGHHPPIGVPWREISGANGFGLLRSVPDYRTLRRWWGDDYPFYNGPCGPCADDCCNHCWHGRPPYPDEDAPGCHAAAAFTAAAPVQLGPGGNVNFTAAGGNPDGFSVESGGIRIENAGTYMAIYTVNVPANAAVSSRFVLTMNGSSIPASAMDVSATADDGTGGNTISTLFTAEEGSLLNLSSLSPVSIGASPASNIFTLTLIAIC